MFPFFEYRPAPQLEKSSTELWCEGTQIASIVEAVGSPVYIYSKAAIEDACQELKEGFRDLKARFFYAVKANSNLSLLRLIHQNGFGMDIVSVGELERVLKAQVPASDVLFSGVGKQKDEIQRAIEVGIGAIQAESLEELELIGRISDLLGRDVRIGIRLNPNIDAPTLDYIKTGLDSNKFGVALSDLSEAKAIILKFPTLKWVGISCHLGSQILDTAPYRESAIAMKTIALELKRGGIPLEWVNLGGGFGIDYHGKAALPSSDYAKVIEEVWGDCPLGLCFEPGRRLVGRAGVLASTVLFRKKTTSKAFLIVDAAMNDLIRPSLYGAFHAIEPVVKEGAPTLRCDVVGPVCETGDFLGRDRELPWLSVGSLVAVFCAGAYGASMASNYNSRARAPEVLVSGQDVQIIRRRERIRELWQEEKTDDFE